MFVTHLRILLRFLCKLRCATILQCKSALTLKLAVNGQDQSFLKLRITYHDDLYNTLYSFLSFSASILCSKSTPLSMANQSNSAGPQHGNYSPTETLTPSVSVSVPISAVLYRLALYGSQTVQPGKTGENFPCLQCDCGLVFGVFILFC